MFQTQNCAVYYTPDMTAPISPEDRECDLRMMNLMVIPVSMALLTTPSRAMDEDLAFALREHIPVLPILLEPGLKPICAREDRFGTLRCLSRAEEDAGGPGYAEELKSFLASVLTDEGLEREVRSAFDARVCLCCRREDRKQAQELMRTIHRDARFRALSIRYEELPGPGKVDLTAVRSGIGESDLLALLVSPEQSGEDDATGLEAYGEAQRRGKPVLALGTGPDAGERLERLFPRLTARADASDEASLLRALEKLLGKMDPGERADDPDRQYHLGAAYLRGIDVEIDRESGMRLLSDSGRGNCLAAQKMLRDLYGGGNGEKPDHRRALVWAKLYAENCRTLLGAEHPVTEEALRALAECHRRLGEYDEEIKLREELYEQAKRRHGADSPQAVRGLIDLAACENSLGRSEKALAYSMEASRLMDEPGAEQGGDAAVLLGNVAEILFELGYTDEAVKTGRAAVERARSVFGPDHRIAMYFESNLAEYIRTSGGFRQAYEMQQDLWARRSEHLGEEHPETLASMHNIAAALGNMGEWDECLRMQRQVYELRCRVLGEGHPDTLLSLCGVAGALGNLGDHQKARELFAQALEQYREVLGAEHPATLRAQVGLAMALDKCGMVRESLDLLEKALKLQKKVLRPGHPEILSTAEKLGAGYFSAGLWKKAMETAEQVYEMRCRVSGEEDVSAIAALEIFAVACSRAGDRQRALELDEKAYALRCRVSGEGHPDTIHALYNLAAGYFETGDVSRALELGQKACEQVSALYGEDHPRTLRLLHRLGMMQLGAGNVQKALELCERAHTEQAKSIGRDDPETLGSQLDLAKCFLENGNLLRAIDTAENGCILSAAALGGQHEITLGFRSLLSMAYAQVGRKEEALAELEAVYETLRDQLGEAHPRTLSEMQKVIGAELDLGRAGEALELCRRACDLSRNTYGERAGITLNYLGILAICSDRTGDTETASRLYRETHAAMSETFGETDQNTLRALFNLSRFLWRQPDGRQEAVRLMEKAFTQGESVMGRTHPFVLSARDALEAMQRELRAAEKPWDSVFEAIESVKSMQRLDRLLTGAEAARAAKDAVLSYAPGADVTAAAVLETAKKGFLRAKSRGVLFTKERLYSDQLPEDGVEYRAVRTAGLEGEDVLIRLTDGTEYRLDLGNYGPQLAAVLKAVVSV